MKRILSVVFLFALCGVLLCGCTLKPELTAQAEPFVREMLDALMVEDYDTAEALLHPDMLQGSNEEALEALAGLLEGEEILICTQTSLNVSQSSGTGGSSRTETGSVAIGMTDGTDLRLDYIYLSDSKGEGFVRFRLSVGI